MKPVTRFSLQKGWKLLMLDMGVNPADVLRVADLPGDLFGRAEATLTPAAYFGFWRALEQVAGTADLPLRIAGALSVEVFDPALFACLCSPNLAVALARLAEFKPLIGPLILDVQTGARGLHTILDCDPNLGRVPPTLVLAEFAFLTWLARTATRRHVAALRVELEAPPADLAPYAAYFGSMPRRGRRNEIVFGADDAARPFLTEDAALWNFFEGDLRRKLSSLEDSADLAQRVRSVLLELLPTGRASVDDVAARLAMSGRSLQRHLGRASSSFRDVLNATRWELARHYLERSTFAAGEISYLLGFRDCNSFNRAFSAWTGETPGEYRRRHAAASRNTRPPRGTLGAL